MWVKFMLMFHHRTHDDVEHSSGNNFNEELLSHLSIFLAKHTKFVEDEKYF